MPKGYLNNHSSINGATMTAEITVVNTSCSIEEFNLLNNFSFSAKATGYHKIIPQIINCNGK